MKWYHWTFIAAAVLLLISGAAFAMRRKAPVASPGTAGDRDPNPAPASPDAVRGLRNNNPGNIVIAGSNWMGKVPASQNTDGKFEQFTDLKFGVRALIKLLQNYQSNYKLKTVRQIINKFAPASENPVSTYLSTIYTITGINADVVVDLTNKSQAYVIVKAITAIECGSPIDFSTFNEAWQIL